MVQWKYNNYLKKGKSTDHSNYRPISLTSNCCKVIESIITHQLLEYLKLNNVISQQQHGFLSRHSTCMQILELK